MTIRPCRPGEEAYAAEAHRRIYAEEYGWGPAFTDYVAGITADFAAGRSAGVPVGGSTDAAAGRSAGVSAGESDPAPEELWVAEAPDGRLVGCILLSAAQEPETGQLRLFLVEKAYRRRGIGTALTDVLMERARAAGYRRLILWTAGPLTEALRGYEKMGFAVTEEAVNTSWRLDGGTVTEIKMEMTL